MQRRHQFGKRLFDLTVAVPAIILLSPLIALTAILVRISLGSPVLFRQTRPGLLGKPFILVKFRTMTDERDENGELRSDAKRVTLMGAFLRTISLDELPQLWNVLRGDMSLVGPRPLLMEYLPHYTKEQNRRHSVPPGITGWAQINGRNVLLFSKRLKLDVWYVDNWSLWLDIKILVRTFFKVLRSSGVKIAAPVDGVDDLGLHPETRKALKMQASSSASPNDLRALR